MKLLMPAFKNPALINQNLLTLVPENKKILNFLSWG
jgi:hypothetical protein